MRNKKNGVIYKGCFIPMWGGVTLYNSMAFGLTVFDSISPCLRANKDDAGVAVYVEDNDAWLCMEEPTERSGI